MQHFYLEAQELAQQSAATWPTAFQTTSHLVYSSPATLSFTSPGAEGFGVKRAALTFPNSVMLLFSPGCCGRNTAAVSGFHDRISYLTLDETDIVTGRYLPRIVEACEALVASRPVAPEVIVLCSTCVDALLGTDMDRLSAKASAATGIPVVSATMYALTREGHLPPMVLVRKTLYSLLKKSTKKADRVTLLGNFTHLDDACELYDLLRGIGVRHIYEIGRMRSMQEYQEMATANFTLVLNPEARLAADHFATQLGIPSVELTQTFELAKIHAQYQALGQVLKTQINDAPYAKKAEDCLARVAPLLTNAHLALGQTSNAEPIALALAILRMGGHVAEIFTEPNPRHLPLITQIARLSPKTRFLSNLSPSMLAYTPTPGEVTLTIGRDAGYYHPECPNVPFCDEAQPFGYQGLIRLLTDIEHALAEQKK